MQRTTVRRASLGMALAAHQNEAVNAMEDILLALNLVEPPKERIKSLARMLSRLNKEIEATANLIG